MRVIFVLAYADYHSKASASHQDAFFVPDGKQTYLYTQLPPIFSFSSSNLSPAVRKPLKHFISRRFRINLLQNNSIFGASLINSDRRKPRIERNNDLFWISYMSTSGVSGVYLHVVDSVVNKLREEFVNEGVDDSVLTELQGVIPLSAVWLGIFD
ncbi:hypothetical protein ACLOJK_024590 [Asimina triloba]